jgi:hypothetical protein
MTIERGRGNGFEYVVLGGGIVVSVSMTVWPVDVDDLSCERRGRFERLAT